MKTMKKQTTIGIIICAALFSCKKMDADRPKPKLSQPVSHNAFIDDVWRYHTIGGGPISTKWTDTSAYVKNAPYLNVVFGDSFIENWVYENSWKDSMAIAPYYCLNRGIGGQTYGTMLRMLDSVINKYGPKLKTLTVLLGTNHWLKDNGNLASWSGTTNGVYYTSLRSQMYAFFYRFLQRCPTAGLNIVTTSTSPKLQRLGYASDISLYNYELNRIVDSLKTAYPSNPGRFRIALTGLSMDEASASTCSFCPPTWTYIYRPDSIHPNTTAYKNLFVYEFREAIRLNTGTAPAPAPIPYPNPVGPLTARAGANQTIPVGYCLINATTSTCTGGWISAFEWSQVSGPNTVTLTTPNTGQTRMTGMIKGVYTFRVKVTGIARLGSVYVTYIAYDEVQVTFN